MSADFVMADLFCGGGGTSDAALDAIRRLGKRPKLSVFNHWKTAIETQIENHPEARHFCASLDGVNPRDIYSPNELDALWASPECTNHTRARRGEQINDQSRATAWCVTRWAEALLPDVLWVENVPEFLGWGPLGANNKPIKARKGEIFAAWLSTIRSLGYKVDHRILVAADYGDPTTRRRLFIQAVRGKRRIVWPDATHAREAELFGDKLPWVSARQVIDFSLPAPKISERKKPLARRTIDRIREGLKKFGGDPFLVCMEHGGRVVSANEPFPTITTAKGGAMAIVEPFLIEYYGTGGARSTREPFSTITCRDRFALVIPEVGGCRMRMIAKKEYAAGQGFRPDYKFIGNGSEVKKQIGNAVPRKLARAIILATLSQNSDIRSLLEMKEAA